ncbi:MAG: hypothetical protein IKJ44_02370 [Elusimicrobiaceae bacterium]|nr:hypothetical protein [Elusimicrobiaceae bacterium]MBR3899095.1 hypothetical protein [Elusimicrobiaceae bacterium]
MHKIIAYFLLFVGLATLFFSFTGMYQTFVNKKPVVQVLQLKNFNVNTQYGPIEMEASSVNQILNLSLFALLMMFLAGLGAKVAGIGNNLLKTERICETLQTLSVKEALDKQKDIQRL